MLTDLYVQTKDQTGTRSVNSPELAWRLIDEVDDATRAAVRARLAIYPATPREIAWKLQLSQVTAGPPYSPQHGRSQFEETFELDPASDLEIVAETEAPISPDISAPMPILSMQPEDAAKLIEMFLAADSKHRAQILHGLTDTPLKPSTPVDPRRAARGRRDLGAGCPGGRHRAF